MSSFVFSLLQANRGDKADKVGKDTNFVGLTILNKVFYLTKSRDDNCVSESLMASVSR